MTGIATYRWSDWSLSALVELKRSSGTSVSLVVPARNEAATVGSVVSRVRAALMSTVDLIDEVVVIDSDSSDATAAVAASAGASVFSSAAVRPDLGSFPGKGEAMWKSLFVTSGDVIVFMDADLVEWDTHFIPGLLGPLLSSPSCELVKGFYERPGEHGPLDGGRVTELVARPALSLWWPELAGLVQPLAGEWAVHRSLFEELSVPVGYAVEIAALIDTLESRGVEAIAQVDLGERSHSHQPLLDLGVMSAQLMAAMAARSARFSSPSEESRVDLVQWRRVESGEIEAVVRDVLTHERLPANSVSRVEP
ncbi:glucosyl-3-phosphoglycerate synthase [Nocardioides sp. Kera G14]|uniref:glucosyl-3-phosphoglycerate synthase n=1 Tax=Nocardioides sp. Kera G14 TaxID=2884264 RepID=UPI001D101B31|nr:glucosyl-3-phosphoglycerate synthase [Nocardioides sp. Kera G14]UDY23086.1 glucosyl-3-phosphoglycerate synthase [Nocardioides sp. Kera G14]